MTQVTREVHRIVLFGGCMGQDSNMHWWNCKKPTSRERYITKEHSCKEVQREMSPRNILAGKYKYKKTVQLCYSINHFHFFIFNNFQKQSLKIPWNSFYMKQTGLDCNFSALKVETHTCQGTAFKKTL